MIALGLFIFVIVVALIAYAIWYGHKKYKKEAREMEAEEKAEESDTKADE